MSRLRVSILTWFNNKGSYSALPEDIAWRECDELNSCEKSDENFWRFNGRPGREL